MAKIVPAQNKFVVSVPHGTIVNVDIAQCLSILNRRMYRQGMNYFVESVSIHSPAAAVLGVASVPDTWVTQNAWKKGYGTWRTMQNEYLDGMGSALKGKWADFKVLLDNGGENFITPVDGNSDAYLLGEWIYSNFVYDDAGTARSPAIALIGSSTDDTHIGLIEAYGDARNFPGAAPQNPSEIQTGFYAQFHGVGDIDDELGADLRDDNDLPPYDQDDYPGGAANGDHPIQQYRLATTGEYPMAIGGGFTAPCGLLQFAQTQASGTSAMDVFITIGVGPYKGVMASKMGQ
jgi:hypothetical protein